MSIYELGSVGDRIVSVKNCNEECVVTIKHKDVETKFRRLLIPSLTMEARR